MRVLNEFTGAGTPLSACELIAFGLPMAGFLTFTLPVCVCVSECLWTRSDDISKSIQSINFIFGGSLPCGPRKKPLGFEKKNRIALGYGWAWGGGAKFGPNDKR